MTSLRDLEVSREFPARLIRIAADDRHDAVVMRPTAMTDAEHIQSAVDASITELRSYMPWAHESRSPRAQLLRLRESEAEYYAGSDMVMGLFREADGVMVAMVGLHPRVPLNPKALEIGYWTPTICAGRGWATLATRAALVYAFDKLGADRVQVMCDESNEGSRKVIAKCGFVLEGVMANVTSAVTQELRNGGFKGTARHPMFAHVPPTFEAEPWLSGVRARLSYVNLAGYACAREFE